MIISKPIQFAEVLAAIDLLSLDEQETLVAILKRRLVEEGRRRLIADIQQARKEFEAGQCRAVTVEELMREIEL